MNNFMKYLINMYYLESTEVKTEDEDKLNRNSNLKKIKLYSNICNC
jgi:hypothetical protein